MRIVSLLPSATETVVRLGHATDLVGRSAECDYPEWVASVPVVMRPRMLDADRPSGEIDARVRETRGRGESLYVLDAALLRVLRPELILTQDLCGVCSVTGDEVRAACAAAGITPRVVPLTPHDLDDVRRDIRSVASALGDPARGEALDLELRARQAAVVGRPRIGRRTVAVIEWVDPPILAGLWAPEMIEIAGGRPVGGDRRGEVGVRTTWSALASSAPDLVIVAPCSFRLERTRAEIARPSVRHGLASLGGASIWLADEAYFSRPGPRLWDGLELLADLIDRGAPRAPFPVAPWTPGPAAVEASA
jgi:iron complex transport system substrate-binding protein